MANTSSSKSRALHVMMIITCIQSKAQHLRTMNHTTAAYTLTYTCVGVMYNNYVRKYVTNKRGKIE